MSDAVAVLIHQHQECDALLARVEKACQETDWQATHQFFQEAEQALLSHLALEEQQLFPAFELVTGMRHGPTEVMRDEHAAMRDLLENCRSQLLAKHATGLQAELDTLLVVIQQHNAKEENVLYPMCQQRIADLGNLIQRQPEPA